MAHSGGLKQNQWIQKSCSNCNESVKSHAGPTRKRCDVTVGGDTSDVTIGGDTCRAIIWLLYQWMYCNWYHRCHYWTLIWKQLQHNQLELLRRVKPTQNTTASDMISKPDTFSGPKPPHQSPTTTARPSHIVVGTGQGTIDSCRYHVCDTSSGRSSIRQARQVSTKGWVHKSLGILTLHIWCNNGYGNIRYFWGITPSPTQETIESNWFVYAMVVRMVELQSDHCRTTHRTV